MDASNFLPSSRKSRILRPSFVTDGNLFNIRDLSSLPCSSVSSFRMLSLCSQKHCNLIAHSNAKRGIDTKLSSSRRIPLRQESHPCLLKPCQGKREDSEGSLSGEGIILDEQTLEQQLQVAVEEENYSQAAKIRDSLKLLQEDSKAAVLAANTRFYNAFRKGDLAAMQALWSKGENVCVVHPGVSGISGYELVMGSWEFVWADYEFPLKIDVTDVQVHVKGDIGYVTCVEKVKTSGSNWGRQFATNVFEKIDGQWFICIHHASHVDL